MVVQETRAENGQMLASVQIRDLEGEKPRLIIAVPVGMSLQPGIRVVLEGGQGQPQPQAMRYEVCLPHACFAQMELQRRLQAELQRRGEEAQRRLQEQQQRQQGGAPGGAPAGVPMPGAPAGMAPLAPPQR